MTSGKKFDCIAIPSPSFSKNKILVAEASALAHRLVVNTADAKFNEIQLADFLNDARADGAIIGTDPLSANVIRSLKYLKAVGKYGVGCDNVDIGALDQASIHFGWEGGVNRRSVAELALGFMLGHQRNIFRSADRMQRGLWQKNGGYQLSEKTIGIVGFGFIGTDLASLLKPFGCELLIHDVIDKKDPAASYGAKQVSYSDVIERSDIITFHVPGGEKTKHMFSRSEIARARPHCLVVNTSRGRICEFDSVITAVKNHQLGGYASDVFPDEPMSRSDLTIEQGFYFTPHIGGNAEEAILAMGRAAIRGLASFSR
jgi:phosphoglycerate dehydrogenase-like enzyme